MSEAVSGPSPSADGLHIRAAVFSDVAGIAQVHADSWRRHYRGTYSDTYLDGELLSERLRVWTQRLQLPDPHQHTLVAESRTGLIGFAHVVLTENEPYGALLDNLHVRRQDQRLGVGSRLLRGAATRATSVGSGMHLWVQEPNTAAQAFYRAHGAEPVGRAPIDPPGGVSSRLTGTPHKLRYHWTAQQLATLACKNNGAAETSASTSLSFGHPIPIHVIGMT